MVVLAIVALGASAVVLAFPGRDALLDSAERFAARADAAGDYAVLSQRPVRLSVDAQGYRFEERAASTWRTPADRRLAGQSWNADALVEGGEATTIFDPAGAADPLAVTLIDPHGRVRIAIGPDSRPHIER